MECPICGTEIDEDKYKVAEKLTDLGYFHLDIWVKCPKCKYTPCFGKEMGDAKPIYWFPRKLPKWFRDSIVAAFEKYVPNFPCLFCKSEMELHKVWINSWKQDTTLKVRHDGIPSTAPVPVREEMHFAVPTFDGKLSMYFLPSGILAQYKCTNWKCKYVRYVTL